MGAGGGCLSSMGLWGTADQVALALRRAKEANTGPGGLLQDGHGGIDAGSARPL